MPTDPNTLQAGRKTDVWVAEEWMGWHWSNAAERRDDRRNGPGWHDEDGVCRAKPGWSPSTNPAHAVEALLKADGWAVQTIVGFRENTGVRIGISCELWIGERVYSGRCLYSETNGNKGEAMALAICRAIAAAKEARLTTK